MPDPGRQTPKSPQRSKVVRSQKIQPPADPDLASTSSHSSSSRPAGSASRSSEDKRRRDEHRNRSASNASSGASSTGTGITTGTTTVPASSIVRSHTPGHLSTKSHDRRRKPSELTIRQRSQSATSATSASTAANAAAATTGVPPPPPLTASSSTSHLSIVTPPSSRTPTRSPHRHASEDQATLGGRESPALPPPADGSGRRPSVMRSTSAIVSKPSVYGSIGSGGGGTSTPSRYVSAARGTGTGSGAGSAGGRSGRNTPAVSTAVVAYPPLVDPKTAPEVPLAPSSGMYWSRAPVSGIGHPALRAHTATLVGSNIFVFGGCDARTCFNDLYVLDADSFHWSKPAVAGDTPLPLRAMTCTAVGKKLVVFGGGDGPDYYNDVYVLDTANFRWSRPRIATDRPVPSKRRAHTACLYKNGLYIFGGGDGVRALNDVWRLDVNDTHKMAWKMISGPSASSTTAATAAGASASSRDLQPKPKPRGYHTANMVGSKLIIFGGSDGGECFNDVWVYDVETYVWRAVQIPVTHRRLSHTATIVGSYLFVVGGHDGTEYSNDVLLLNLVTMAWDRRKVYGLPPSGRGYHGTVLYDSRLMIIGGFDGSEVFGDVWLLELAVHAYYSQISHFSIEV